MVYRAAVARQKLHEYIEGLKQGDELRTPLDRNNKDYSSLRGEADLLAAAAKFHASNCAFNTSNRSVQIFGSIGYAKTARVARHFLDSRATTIYEGANEVLQLKIAAQILGHKYRAY
jgi:alkylation response protein AidB-like acyl-CoA dehydrogenase